MSLVDPSARDRDPAVLARRRAVWLTLMLAAALAVGYGASIFGDYPGSFYSFGTAEHGALAKLLLLLVGCVATILTGSIVVRLPKTGGVRGQQSFILGLAALAVAAGQFIGSLLPTVIARYAGTDLSAARTGLRIQSGALALVAVALMVWAVRRQRRTEKRGRLRATGRQTSGVVTEVHDTGATTNNAPWIRLTVKFTDATGHERFIRRHLTVSRLSRPAEGDRIPVWFDPEDPGNEQKIVLGTDT